jgi:redox-sensing transcriptional repressor
MASRKTVARMSRYRRLLTALHASGTESIYSHQLARHAVVSAPQVRRDLMAIGYSGSPNKGYDVAACIDSIASFLDGPARQDVCLVGVGNLGRAVLAHFAQASPSVAIVAAFDTDPALRDVMVDGCRCFAADRMEQLVRDLGIEIAVLTVPGEAAQQVADALVRGGVKSLISFAPTPLQLPGEVFVEYMDITAALESAAFFARLGASTNGNDEAGEAELAPMVQRLGSLLARKKMRLEELANDIGARIVAPGRPGGTEVTRIYAGDRVSDLLNEASDTTLLVSNLASVQMLRVAELMDVPGICFVGGIEPDDEVVELARTNGTLLMVSPLGVFETCGLIYRFLGGDESPTGNGAAPGAAGGRGGRTGG